MQYLAAYTLASLSGKEPSTSIINSANDTVTNILKATGQKFDAAEVTKVCDTLKGKKLEDVNNWFKAVDQGRFRQSRISRRRISSKHDHSCQDICPSP